MNLLSLYSKLPLPLQKTAVALRGMQYYFLRYRGVYRSTLEAIAPSEAWDKQAFATQQSRLLLRLLQEAKAGSTYYGDVLARWSNEDLQELAGGLDIADVPFLTKGVLRSETAHLTNGLRKRAETTSTSGTTGSPLTVEWDRESVQTRAAFLHRHRQWAGLEPFARSVRLGGRRVVPSSRQRPPFWISNPIERQLLVSTYHLREDLMPDIVNAIDRFRPELLEGYPSAVNQLAEYMHRNSLSFTDLKVVITTAETLEPDTRASIENGLGVPVLNYYAASEGVPFIQECRQGRLHVRPESGIFEVVNNDGTPVSPGESGELVVTSFIQWKTPLIRYMTGDIVTVSTDQAPCPCGRTLPIVESVLGRSEDQVITRDGRYLGMFSYRTLKEVTGITEAQIIQRTPDDFLVLAVPERTQSPETIEHDVTAIFTAVLGYRPSVTVETVDHIERGANGKFRSVIRQS